MEKGYKLCPYCGEEIKEIAKKCRYCYEFLDEEVKSTKKEKYKCNGCGQFVKIGEKICPGCGANLSRGDKIQKEMGKKKFKCNGCGKIVKFGDKNCPECGNSLNWREVNKKYNYFRSWGELSVGEQKYITKKLGGWRILTLFLPPIGLIWSRRWGDLVGLLILYLVCSGFCALGGPVGLAELVNLVLSRFIALVSFSKEAYKHDIPYFQKYLDEYAELHKKP